MSVQEVLTQFILYLTIYTGSRHLGHTVYRDRKETNRKEADTKFTLFQCGMSTGGNSEAYSGSPTPQGSYIENTIIVQYDPLLQEVWDQARKMRCTW